MKCFRLGVAVAVFFVAAVVLNGRALFRAAENMEFDAAGRKTFMRVTEPIVRFAHALHLDSLRDKTEQFERGHLE